MTEGVRGYEFLEFFKKVPIVLHHYLKVCSLDEIPTQLKIRQFVVVNLSTKIEPGTHWIVIFRSAKYVYEIFNSLGFSNLDILEPYFRPTVRVDVIYNEQQFQSNTSTNCGFYCVYLAIHRVLCYDQPLVHVLDEIFDSSNIEINERRCVSFCERLRASVDDSAIFDDDED